MPGDVDLGAVMGVDLYQHLDPAPLCAGREFARKGNGFGQHKAASTRLLDGVAHGIEPDNIDAAPRKCGENVFEIGATLRMGYVDVDLLRGEGRPEYFALTRSECGYRERQARAWPIDGEQVFRGGTLGKHPIHGEKHARKGRVRALVGKILKLR